MLYTDKELAESHIFPSELSENEKKVSDAELKRLRFLRLSQMSNSQKLLADLLRLKFQIEDYITNGKYSEENSFGVFLQEYIRVLGKKQIEIALEISLHPTKLSSIMANKANPNIALAYRLEKHSDGLIPALFWWKLWVKKIENDIVNDEAGKKREANKVQSKISFLF